MIPKETLTDYKEVFEKADKLVNEESKNDPPVLPYYSHYVARDLLVQLERDLKKALTAVIAARGKGTADEFIYQVLLGHVLRYMGQISVHIEDAIFGETLLKECLTLLDDIQDTPEAIIPYLGALKELAILNANRQDYQEAFENLERLESNYKSFKDTGKDALGLSDILGTIEEIELGKGNNDVEELYTLCTFYLAQVYSNMNQLEMSALYCNTTLRRQINSPNLDHVDWALNAATLSQCYIGQYAFKAARHLLSAATHIIKEYEKKITDNDLSEEQRNDITETFKHRYADIARCWAKYGINLLSASKQRLELDRAVEISEDMKNLVLDSDKYVIPSLKLDDYEKRITADYCLTFDDAKRVYHFVVRWLDSSKEYYKAETDATEYAKIILDYADLYSYIAFFEEDPTNQSKMQKRRAIYFEELLAILNPEYYLSICRECWFGAGIAYSKMLDVELDLIKESGIASGQLSQKANKICLKAIAHFKDYIKSYALDDGITMKQNVDTEDERTVLMAYFYVGRLYYKLTSPDVQVQLNTAYNSMKFYKLFLNECDIRTNSAELLKDEIGVCREMVNLLPLKIKNLQTRLHN